MEIQKHLSEKQTQWFGPDWKTRHPLYWLISMAGEAGESLNSYKKIWRDREQMDNTELGMLRQRVVTEVADTMIYAYLFAESVGLDPEEVIRAKTTANDKKYTGRSELTIALMPPDLK